MGRSYLCPRQTGSEPELYNLITNRVETDRLTVHIHKLFRAQVMGPAFPCALGKAAFARLTYRFGVYESIESEEDAKNLCYDLWAFVAEQPSIGTSPDEYSTFVVVFKNSQSTGEMDFENKLWGLLCKIHAEDAQKYTWDAATSSDPEDPNFSFSVSMQSFFVVGMHGLSSRISRRFVYPAIAFNAHHQFAHLRQMNKFIQMQNIIRRNDTAIQGSINPSLTNYGSASEAKQYSGRLVLSNWKCPFPKS